MKYQSEEQIQRAKLLSPDTITALENEVEDLTETLVSTSFDADPVSRETAILAFVEAQAKRRAYIGLLNDAALTYQAIAEAHNLIN